METMRESWTDERLDDLSDRMDRGFEQAAAERREIRAEIRDVHGEMKELRAETRALCATMERRFDSLQQTLLLGAAGVIAALIGLIATQL